MRKLRFAAILAFIFTLLLLQGCGKDPVQEDLLNYINTELPKLATTEQKVLDAYDSVTGSNFKDDITLYETLEGDIIPTYLKFIEDLETIKPATTEVQKLHEQYIAAANTQHSGFIMIMSAIEKQDSAEIATANDKLASARQMVREWETALNELSNAHGVKINP